MDEKFIVTTFPETAKVLESLGFELLQKSGNQWTFLNNNKIVFSDEAKDICYTNKINV